MILRFQNLHHSRDRANTYHWTDELGARDSWKYGGTVCVHESTELFKASAASAESPGSASSLFEIWFVCRWKLLCALSDE
jgi:hypothetical protein